MCERWRVSRHGVSDLPRRLLTYVIVFFSLGTICVVLEGVDDVLSGQRWSSPLDMKHLLAFALVFAVGFVCWWVYEEAFTIAYDEEAADRRHSMPHRGA